MNTPPPPPPNAGTNAAPNYNQDQQQTQHPVQPHPNQPLATILQLRVSGMRTVEFRDQQGHPKTTQEPAFFWRKVVITSAGNRFLNSLLDGLVFMLPAILITFLTFSSQPYDFDPNFGEYGYNSYQGIRMNNYYFFGKNGEWYLILLSYYFLMEWRLGKTIGKYVTRSVVVNKYGLPATPSEIGVRTICRIIPFEAFSFLGEGRGWHDSIADTWVVPDEEAKELQRLMRDQYPGHPEYVKYDQAQGMKSV
jgi:uncharacterized RDD family membrane protein YckC